MTNRCVTSAVKNKPTAPAMGATTSPPQERQEALVSPRTEKPGYSPGDAQEGEQPDQERGDLDADQGEHQRAEQAALASKPREEGLGLEHYAPHDLYEAVERI